MIKELCVIGNVSTLGGADTELMDQIKCWFKMGIKTYILHTGPLKETPLKKEVEIEYNCEYLTPRMWNQCKDMHCISFCNGQFLTNLHLIKKHARSTTFVNCMTWNFKKEIDCQKRGLIDFHLYQTEHAHRLVSKGLKQFDNYKPLMFDPYFDCELFPYMDNRSVDRFRFGRISRSDMAKYNNKQFDIYDSIVSPIRKSGLVLGWTDRINKKVHLDKSKLDEEQPRYNKYIQLYPDCEITQQEFYKFCDVMILTADTFENLPRVGFECMSSGSVMVVNNRGGWQQQIENGVTGFLCDTPEEFIDKSSLLASNAQLKEDLRGAARHKLELEWGMEKSMKSWDLVFKEWEKI
jgi:glycosyltransferase involved in cell wall biosynthesis